jgi:diacylglycerol kinase family enzyme
MHIFLKVQASLGAVPRGTENVFSSRIKASTDRLSLVSKMNSFASFFLL